MEKNLDFRSDTVTWPTLEMREAAAKAVVGDDGYGEDPSVNELEKLAAKILGKEAALFVTSGTQGNVVSILAHTNRGDAIILEADSHIYDYSANFIQIMGGLKVRPIHGELGWIKPEDIKHAIRAENIHYPKISLLCIENPHNEAGGIPLTMDQLRADWEVAKAHNLSIHLDGARLFNAAIALGVNVKNLSQYADTVMVCLSKGLSAPVGSLVAGTEYLIKKARKYRTMLGGGMRQAGIIATPRIIALTKMVDRLVEDHNTAKLLAEGLKRIEGIKVLNPVLTNMVYIDYSGLGWSNLDWINACNKLGWKTIAGPVTRLCTHYGIEEEDIKTFIEGLNELVQSKS